MRSSLWVYLYSTSLLENYLFLELIIYSKFYYE